ncbi:tyrosine-protein phosphatase [Dokdonella soli]|uniref:protein-tyrosine-phosphatase n=2 Tax=Dokdonella soli TaxID=529810 RepID=A0ABN1ID37_9GAMM
MAQIAVKDGIHTIGCTPHIYPGMYENTTRGIRSAVAAFQAELDQRAIALRLVEGADVYLEPDLVSGIDAGRVPTLAGSRYLLLEPPHHVAPPRFEESVFQLTLAGYVPVITHPERLTWLPDHYRMFSRLVKSGTWMQITAGSVTGRFGRQPRYWSERMLDDGIVHILATDSHHPTRRPPLLAEARHAAAIRVGAREAEHLVVTRPRGIVNDSAPSELPPLPNSKSALKANGGFWKSLARGTQFATSDGRRT